MNIRESKLYKNWEVFCKLESVGEQDFVLGGSTILLIKEIRKIINDMDIIVTNPEVWKKLVEEYALQESESTREKVISILGGKIELSNGFLKTYKSFEFNPDDPKHIEIIDGLKVMTLRMVEKYKRILNRPKDRRDLRLVDKYKENQRKKRKKIY